ncbi:MAG: hypothetical protein HY549_08205 [Elusimicrobia bacterium]|nr:hypothetical protein [Elusimicrobiota bacterium]
MMTWLLPFFWSEARACAVCFGQADQPGLLSGLGWGLVVLLSFTFLGISGIVLAAWRIERRRNWAEAKLPTGGMRP